MGKTATTARRASTKSAPVISTETTETAVAALAHVDMRGGATIDATTAVLNELATRGFNEAIERAEISTLAHLAIAQTDKGVAKSFYMRGGVAGELILAAYPAALAAARLDNPGWEPDFNGSTLKNPPVLGTNCMAYGHHVCEKGHRAGPEKTPEEKAAAASKAAQKRLEKKLAAADANGDATVKGNGDFITPETVSDFVRTCLNAMVKLRLHANSDKVKDFVPVVVGTWLNKSCADLEALLEKHQDDDGIK